MAAVDLGSNSFRLLIAEYTNDKFMVKKRHKRTTRIGKSIKNERLSSEAISRTLQVIDEFVDLIKDYGVENVKIVGTSALREAENTKKITDKIREKYGYKVDIISGSEEARLVYQGVLDDFSVNNILVLDIGGGSTEFIWQKEKINFKSTELGAVRLTEKYINSAENPLKNAVKTKIENHIKLELANSFSFNLEYQKAIGMGGTVTTLGAIAQKMKEYDPAQIHKFSLSRKTIDEIYLMLAERNLFQRKKVTGLEPARADIICTGIIILMKIMDHFGLEKIKISERDLLYGILKEMT